MITRNFDIEIDDTNPFANDAFGRNEVAGNLTRLVSTTSEPYVLALDAGWGSGKTTFIRMWMRQMQIEGKQALYFNAWENDFSSDPMISFIGEMHSMIETGDFGAETETPARQQYDKLKKVGGKIIRRGVPIAARLLTAGILDIKDEDIETAFSDLAEQIAKEQIESYEADRASLIEFRETLGAIAESITQYTGSPLIFFIDELDRCKPTYAIELLERLKHLFSVPNIVFVLALDKAQLIHSVNSVYGSGMDARGYLRRFIDVEFNLPLPSLASYIDSVAPRVGMNTALQYADRQNVQEFVGMLKMSVALVDPSIRQLQLIMTRLGIVIKAFRFARWTDFSLVPFLLVLRSFDYELYQDFLYHRKRKSDLLELVSKKIDAETIGYRGRLLAFVEYFYTSTSERGDIANEYAHRAEQHPEHSSERRELEIASDLINRFSDPADGRYHPAIMISDQYLKTVLEFSERFNLG